MTAIRCENISKTFNGVQALAHVNLTLERGKIYALLGRNGAGKTTLMNCLCTKYIPDEGEIYLLDEIAYENEKVLKQICFMSDYIDAFEIKKVKGILKYAATFYENWDKELEKRLLDFFEINKSLMYASLSKGKQTAISIIIGLCSGCEIVLFDEIYSGLDAAARRSFYEILMEEQEKNPRTFVVSTHLIEEMTGIFTDVVVLHRGKLILNEDMEMIHSKSYKCIGRTDKEECLKGKKVLYKTQMAAMTEYVVYDDFTPQEKQKLEEEGFSITSLSLQELFIAYTADGNREWRK